MTKKKFKKLEFNGFTSFKSVLCTTCGSYLKIEYLEYVSDSLARAMYEIFKYTIKHLKDLLLTK